MIYRCIIEFGHSIAEYKKKYGKGFADGELWSFPYEECFDGTIELTGECVLWFIDGRLYETGERVK